MQIGSLNQIKAQKINPNAKVNKTSHSVRIPALKAILASGKEQGEEVTELKANRKHIVYFPSVPEGLSGTVSPYRSLPAYSSVSGPSILVPGQELSYLVVPSEITSLSEIYLDILVLNW